MAGGAGFVGSHVCEELLTRGHDVVCVDDFSTGARSNVDHLTSSARFEVIEADVASAPQVEVEAILHLASPASPVDYARMPLHTMAANSLGTWRLLDIAAATGARLTFVSTSEVYGDPLVHPQPESYWGNVDPVGPRSCYDESKRFGEALVMAMRAERGVRANIVRLFNTYGPRMRLDDGRVIPAFFSSVLRGEPLVIHGDGSQTRSFCYVSDLVAGLLAVALDDTIDGEIFNLGNPEEVTILQLAEAVRREFGVDAPIHHLPSRAGDPARRRPDIGRIRSRYGWEPTVSLEAGLARTAAALGVTAGAARL